MLANTNSCSDQTICCTWLLALDLTSPERFRRFLLTPKHLLYCISEYSVLMEGFACSFTFSVPLSSCCACISSVSLEFGLLSSLVLRGVTLLSLYVLHCPTVGRQTMPDVSAQLTKVVRCVLQRIGVTVSAAPARCNTQWQGYVNRTVADNETGEVKNGCKSYQPQNWDRSEKVWRRKHSGL